MFKVNLPQSFHRFSDSFFEWLSNVRMVLNPRRIEIKKLEKDNFYLRKIFSELKKENNRLNKEIKALKALVKEHNSAIKSITADSQVFIKEKPDIEDFIKFHFYRFRYTSSKKLVDLYNKEYEIGLTDEILQLVCLISIHKILTERFGKSPMEFERGKGVFLKGKIYLTGDSFEYEINKKLRVVKS